MLAIVAVALLAAAEPPSLPAWFPAPDGRYELKDLTFRAYDEFPLAADRKLVTAWPRNNGGYALVAGRVWRFELGKPKADAWTAAVEQLQKQGFVFVHGDASTAKSSASLMKGEGKTATFVAFWQCCNSVAIIEPAPNPFRVHLTPPAQQRETFGPRDDVPYFAPLEGATLSAGVNDDPRGINVSPTCNGRTEPFGTHQSRRTYDGPSGASDFAIRQTYEEALRAAGWEQLCEGGSHSLSAHYTRSGRDVWVQLAPAVSGNKVRYEVTVADAGSGLAKQLDTACTAPVYGVNFDFDRATLRPDSEPALNQVLELLQARPKLALEIGGHTDDKGDAAYNLKLSDARAASVVKWLEAHGIASKRLTSRGYGKSLPLVPNTNDENRAKNRRVELKRSDCH